MKKDDARWVTLQDEVRTDLREARTVLRRVHWARLPQLPPCCCYCTASPPATRTMWLPWPFTPSTQAKPSSSLESDAAQHYAQYTKYHAPFQVCLSTAYRRKRASSTPPTAIAGRQKLHTATAAKSPLRIAMLPVVVHKGNTLTVRLTLQPMPKGKARSSTPLCPHPLAGGRCYRRCNVWRQAQPQLPPQRTPRSTTTRCRGQAQHPIPKEYTLNSHTPPLPRTLKSGSLRYR